MDNSSAETETPELNPGNVLRAPSLDQGLTIQMVIRTGIPFAISAPIPGCPQGLEPLSGQKTFYFEEVQLGFLERDHDTRYSYNVYVSDGSRIYFIANPASTNDVMSILTYEVLGSDELPVLMLEGNEYGGIWDVCVCCCVCDAHRGIRVKYNGTEVGGFEPVHKKLMPCICSCMNCFFCYIDKYVIEFRDETNRFRKLLTRRPKVKQKKNDFGLEVIDPSSNGRLVAKITNCIISGTRKSRVLPSELQNTSLVSSGVKVQFALSLADAYLDMHPNGKAVLLSLSLFHESEVMSSQRKAVKDTVGFVFA